MNSLQDVPSGQVENCGTVKVSFGKKGMLNKLVNHVVSEHRPAVGGYVARTTASETVKAANAQYAIASIFALMPNALAANMTADREDENVYDDSRMVAMMEAMIDKVLSVKFESVDFVIYLRQTVDDIVSSALYTVKVM